MLCEYVIFSAYWQFGASKNKMISVDINIRLTDMHTLTNTTFKNKATHKCQYIFSINVCMTCGMLNWSSPKFKGEEGKKKKGKKTHSEKIDILD